MGSAKPFCHNTNYRKKDQRLVFIHCNTIYHPYQPHEQQTHLQKHTKNAITTHPNELDSDLPHNFHVFSRSLWVAPQPPWPTPVGSTCPTATGWTPRRRGGGSWPPPWPRSIWQKWRPGRWFSGGAGGKHWVELEKYHGVLCWTWQTCL